MKVLTIITKFVHAFKGDLKVPSDHEILQTELRPIHKQKTYLVLLEQLDHL